MKHSNKTIALLFILLAQLAIVPSARAQEFIREVRNHHDRNSIIHEYKQGAWLVCNYNMGKSVFSMITETGTNTQQLVLGYIPDSDSLLISDFKIFQDTVYFCGTVWFKRTPQAVWGYFPLSGFPSSTTVHYNLRPYVNFKKLEVFSVDSSMNEIHVVITGMQGSYVSGIVVDEMRTSPHQYTEFLLEGGFGFSNITDMIQIENYIVFSVLPNLLYSFNAELVSFEKPTTIGVSVFSCLAQRAYLPYNFQNVLLEPCTGDAFAIVGNNEAGCYVTGMLSPLSYYATVYFPLGKFYILDVCYNKDSKELELLRSPGDMIYHVHSIMALAGGTIPYYLYPEDKLKSISYLNTMPDYFIASGHEASTSLLRVYRYHGNLIQRCFERGAINCEPIEIPWDPRQIETPYKSSTIEMIPLESFPYVTPINFICE